MVSAASSERSRTARRPTNRKVLRAVLDASSGGPTNACTLTPFSSPSAWCRAPAPRRPRALRTRSANTVTGGRSSTVRSLLRSLMCTSGLASASRSSASDTLAASVASVFRNFSRAGMLKNRSRTSIWVPSGSPASRAVQLAPALQLQPEPRQRARGPWWPASSATPRRSRAAPRPGTRRCPGCHRSSAATSFDVACRFSASRASSAVMPQPSSVTRTSRRPPASSVDLDLAGAGVDGVLHQLLHHRGRPLDHLAGGNLLGQLGRQDADARPLGRQLGALHGS